MGDKTKMDLIQAKQEEYCDLMGAFDMYEKKDYPILKQKVAYALFGPPKDTNAFQTEWSGNDVVNYFYNDGQKEKIDLVYKTIIEHGSFDRIPGLLYMSVIFVIGETDVGTLFQTPVFRIRQCHAATSALIHAQEIINILNENPQPTIYKDFCQLYIDDEARVYKNWTQYLYENNLPPCKMYVPQDGVYKRKDIQYIRCGSTGRRVRAPKLVVRELNSPNNSDLSKITKYADVAGTVGGIGSAAVLVAGSVTAITVAPAVIAGAGVVAIGTGIYTGLRSAWRLLDRTAHKQSISLANREARGHWMSLGAGVAAGASSGIRVGAQKLIEEGVTIGTVGRSIINISTGTNIVLSGCSVADSTYGLVTKINKGETPTSLDVLQLTTSILFFGHSVVTAKTATTIINESRGSILSDFQASLSGDNKRQAFNSLLKRTTDHVQGFMKDQSQMIRGLRYIKNGDDLFGSLTRNNALFNKEPVSAAIVSSVSAANKTSATSNLLTTLSNIDPVMIRFGFEMGYKLYKNRTDILEVVNGLISQFDRKLQDKIRGSLDYMWKKLLSLEEFENLCIRLFPKIAPFLVFFKLFREWLDKYSQKFELVKCWDNTLINEAILECLQWLRDMMLVDLKKLMTKTRQVSCPCCKGVYYLGR